MEFVYNLILTFKEGNIMLNRLLILFVLSMPFTVYSATMVFEQDFENGDIKGLKCSGNCPKVSTEHKKSGKYSANFSLRPTMSTKYRTEAVFGSEGLLPFGKEHWFGFDYRHENWEKDSDAEAAPLQIHTRPSRYTKDCAIKSPGGSTSARATAPIFMSVKNGIAEIITYGGKVRWSAPVELNTWSNIVGRLKMSYRDDGYIEMWKDGKKLFRVDGPNSPPTDGCGKAIKDPYMKIGVYKWNWKRKTTDSSYRQLFIDNYKLAVGPDGYDLVSPSPVIEPPIVKPPIVKPPIVKPPVIDKGLIAKWNLKFIKDGYTPDTSGNNNHAQLMNDTQLSADGMEFNGIDNYLYAGKLDLGGEQITVLAKFLSKDLKNCSYFDCRIISKTVGTAEQAHSMMVSTIRVGEEIRLRFRLKINGVTSTIIAEKGTLLENEWTHVAASYDGVTMKLYENGTQVASAAVQGTITSNTISELWIGGNPPDARNKPWLGGLSSISIYNYALTDEEIAEEIAEHTAILDCKDSASEELAAMKDNINIAVHKFKMCTSGMPNTAE